MKNQFTQTLAELERLATADIQADDLEALSKALQQELGTEPLQKSTPAPGEEGAEPAAPAAPVAPAAAVVEEPVRKSQEQIDEEELVKASEAYADLTKSVHEGNDTLLSEIDLLKKSLGATLNLCIKLGGAMVEIVNGQKAQEEAFSKSLQEHGEAMAKSLGTLGAAPVAPNAARIGLGEGEEEQPLKKSKEEILEALQKAVQESQIASYYLSDFGTYKDVNRLPENVREIIGV